MYSLFQVESLTPVDETSELAMGYHNSSVTEVDPMSISYCVCMERRIVDLNIIRHTLLDDDHGYMHMQNTTHASRSLFLVSLIVSALTGFRTMAAASANSFSFW